MSPKAIYVGGVVLTGLLLSYAVGILWFGMALDTMAGPFLVVLALLLAGLPAVLAALPTRAGLITLAACVGPIGAWGGWILHSVRGDGAIGGGLLIVVAIILLLYGLAVIGAGAVLLKKPTDTNDI